VVSRDKHGRKTARKAGGQGSSMLSGMHNYCAPYRGGENLKDKNVQIVEYKQVSFYLADEKS
jgi:hypothetical protein